MLTAVTGINWGDEGKGRVIDLLAEHADVVARYQGGNNAGHTVVTERGKFILNLLPSGILHPDVVCVLGAGMVIDLDHLAGEMDAIEERGVKVGPENLKLSDKATISMPWHKVQDGLEEDRLAQKGAAFGSTRRVGPFDCVASRYGLACQGADKIALTKLDVLSSMKEIPVITGYTLDGVQVPSFDPLSDLDRVKPVVTMLPGWNKDISGCKSWDELPKEAKAYVEFLEKQLGHEIQFVSTGAEREKFVLKGAWL